MSGTKLTQLIEGVITLSGITDENTVFETLQSAITNKIKTVGGNTDQKIVDEIQLAVENHYNLKSGALSNSFSCKDRSLTEPKFMWVIIVLHLFKENRSKTKKFISNGLTRQKVYKCHSEYKQLDESIKPDRQLIETFTKIIKTYE